MENVWFDDFFFCIFLRAFQDSAHTRKLQQRPDPGVREPGEGAGESALLHDDHGDSFNRADH